MKVLIIAAIGVQPTQSKLYCPQPQEECVTEITRQASSLKGALT